MDYTEQELDVVAEKIFDYVMANRTDNLDKNGNPSDPRKVSNHYSTMIEPVKSFYRSLAKFHLTNHS